MQLLNLSHQDISLIVKTVLNLSKLNTIKFKNKISAS